MSNTNNKVTLAGIIVTLGIVYGDIGTSPLYAIRALIGENTINYDLVLGGLSLAFWTLTLQASFKYIYLALTADNHGEGGIFALYSLVRRVSPKWMIYIAMAGCSALLADGIITPAMSLTSAVEGLTKIYPHLHHEVILIIVIVILLGLFTFQQFGTDLVGKIFGPMTLIWFSMLAILGGMKIADHPEVLLCVNPMYAIKLLMTHPAILGLVSAVFLCVTGAEAMYSDLGHCGKQNIRTSWIFVKIALLLNYMGQGSWLLDLAAKGEKLNGRTPFYEIVPEQFLFASVVIATIATVIASQALISGSFSMINEAVKLKVWYKLKIQYPTEQRSQLYIPAINWLLFFGCLVVVLYFRESSKMEHAYGLAITIAMLSTTALMLVFWYRLKHKSLAIVGGIGLMFIIIESGFMYANLLKVFSGAWVTLVMTAGFFLVMYVHYRASRIRSKGMKYLKLDNYKEVICAMAEDTTIPEYTPNLVYMINANRSDEIESSIIDSLLYKEPKRAQTYWFVNIHVADEPYSYEYKPHYLIKDRLYRIDLFLGYRIQPCVNVMFRQVVDELVKKGEIKLENAHPSMRKFDIPPSFKFIITEKKFTFDAALNALDKMTVRVYSVLEHFAINNAEHFNLSTENLVIEKYQIRLKKQEKREIKRKI